MERSPSSPPPPEFRNTWLADLDAVPPPQPWLWQHYLKPGAVTLLTSPGKAGKTTLVSVLLNRLAAGGELAGLPVCAGKAVVVTEEDVVQWRLRKQQFGFGPHVCWICRPFRGRPRLDDWLALLDHVLELCRQHGMALVVFDPLAYFLPGSDSEAGSVLKALLPLQSLTSAGVAVLLPHHPRKNARPDGQWARGSSALTGFADILMEIDYYSKPTAPDRRRTVSAYSRFDDTPRCRVIELAASGIDYASLGDLDEPAFLGSWLRLQPILDSARQKLTRREIMQQWPAGQARPSGKTLWRWLEQAVARGLVQRDGDGLRYAPYRYWNQSLEKKWQEDPMLRQQKEDEDALKPLWDLMRGKPGLPTIDPNGSQPR